LPARRIIPCLDVKDGRVVKGISFINLRDAGSAAELAQKYYLEGADELVFLDITASIEKRKTLLSLVSEVARVIRIPFTVGGGITHLKDIERLLKAGADKVSLNTSIVKNPSLIKEAAGNFGTQAIVAAVDVKQTGNEYKVFINGGNSPTDLEGLRWCEEAADLGAGEILLTSMDRDGSRSGFDLDFIAELCRRVNIPVIASGGAGKPEHFGELFLKTGADAALAAGIFHYGIVSINQVKEYLHKNDIEVRL